MANPFELRWEMYKHASSQLKQNYLLLVERWTDLITKGKDPGFYPKYPTQDDIFALALEIKNFVNDDEIKPMEEQENG